VTRTGFGITAGHLTTTRVGRLGSFAWFDMLARMNRITAAALAFLLFTLAVSGWLLTRSASRGPVDEEGDAGASGQGAHVGLMFAQWSVRDDAFLLADIEPGQGASTVPSRFQVLVVKAEPSGGAGFSDGPAFSWAEVERRESAKSLFAMGFRVNAEGRPYNPPEDPLWSDPIARVDGGTEQVVTLRSKSGVSASFVRHRSDPRSVASWNRRAIGFASPNGRLVYVTPDAVLIAAAAR
jgi:hypothetical protein